MSLINQIIRQVSLPPKHARILGNLWELVGEAINVLYYTEASLLEVCLVDWFESFGTEGTLEIVGDYFYYYYHKEALASFVMGMIEIVP